MTNLISRSATCLFLIGLVALPIPSQAQLFKKSPEKLDTKILKAQQRLELMQADPVKSIPASLLAKARGIVIMQQFKLGLGIGGEGGGGVALVRDSLTNQWSPPAFISNAEGSYGIQIGGQVSDTILLLMDNKALDLLRDGSIDFGVDVRATAGPTSGGGEAKVDTIDSPILVYSDSGGLFAGAAIEGGGIVPANKSNLVYYQETHEAILFQGKAAMTPAGQRLVDKINAYSAKAPTTISVPVP